MSKTPFEPDNSKFSDIAHQAAQTQVYPFVFECSVDRLEFVSTLAGTSEQNDILDGQMGVDRIVKVKTDDLQEAITFTVQERFRRPTFTSYQDMTITEWNCNSNLPSELYKINAGLFVYGYYSQDENKFRDVIVVSVTNMLHAITTKRLRFSRQRNKKNQRFIAIRFAELEKNDCILKRIKVT